MPTEAHPTGLGLEIRDVYRSAGRSDDRGGGGGDDGAIMSGKTGRGRTLLFHPREAV